MQPIDVRWSLFPEDDKDRFGAIVMDTISLLPPWADMAENATAAVERAVTDYIGESEWEEWFGNDATTAQVEIDVHGPPSIAGTYVVGLERVVKATAKRVENSTV